MKNPASNLRAEIAAAGYYPELVAETMGTVLAGEEPVSYVIQHEATFDRDELRRHISLLILTETRLLVLHIDDFPPDETCPVPYASANSEAVRLADVQSIVVNRIVGNPALHKPGTPVREVMLTIGWGAVSRLELEPASCGDPECTADHGFSGTSSNDDFSVRVSEAGDGAAAVTRTLEFAAKLSEAVRRQAR
ncbi:MAG: DUF5998 family protein [Candidatus Nanopelagicales bacterium]|nr:DUF5998 family protein [Candidatus Nanopelagicales bacterium]